MNQKNMISIPYAPQGDTLLILRDEEVASMKFLGASIPMALPVGAMVSQLSVKLPSDMNSALVALRFTYIEDRCMHDAAFFVGVTRKDGLPWIHNERVGVPKQSVYVDAFGEFHVGTREGRLYTTNLAWAQKEPGVGYIDDRNLLCRYADDQAKAEELEAASRNVSEPSPFDKFLAKLREALEVPGAGEDGIIQQILSQKQSKASWRDLADKGAAGVLDLSMRLDEVCMIVGPKWFKSRKLNEALRKAGYVGDPWTGQVRKI